jgi:hypothetical protein
MRLIITLLLVCTLLSSCCVFDMFGGNDNDDVSPGGHNQGVGG